MAVVMTGAPPARKYAPSLPPYGSQFRYDLCHPSYNKPCRCAPPLRKCKVWVLGKPSNAARTTQTAGVHVKGHIESLKSAAPKKRLEFYGSK